MNRTEYVASLEDSIVRMFFAVIRVKMQFDYMCGKEHPSIAVGAGENMEVAKVLGVGQLAVHLDARSHRFSRNWLELQKWANARALYAAWTRHTDDSGQVWYSIDISPATYLQKVKQALRSWAPQTLLTRA